MAISSLGGCRARSRTRCGLTCALSALQCHSRKGTGDWGRSSAVLTARRSPRQRWRPLRYTRSAIASRQPTTLRSRPGTSTISSLWAAASARQRKSECGCAASDRDRREGRAVLAIAVKGASPPGLPAAARRGSMRVEQASRGGARAGPGTRLLEPREDATGGQPSSCSSPAATGRGRTSRGQRVPYARCTEVLPSIIRRTGP